MSYFKKFALLFLGLLIGQATVAQESIPITLEKVLELSGANNLTIKEFKQRQELATAELMKAKEWWLPEIYAGAQAHQLWGAAMNGNGKFFLDANRNNLWLGLGLNAHWDFAKGIYDTKVSRLQEEASAYITQAERNKVLLQGISAYYKLMSAQLNFAAYKNLVAQSDSIIAQIQIQVEAGLLFQSDFLLAQSNKNHLKVEMLNAQKDFNSTSAKLSTILNLDKKTKLVSVDATLLPLDYSEELIITEDAAYLNRPEIKANDLTLQALRVKKKAYTTGLLMPELNLGINGSQFGRINGNVVPTDAIANPNTNQLYPTGIVNASLMWRLPLGALVYNGDNKKYNSLIQLQEINAEKLKATINEEIEIAISHIQVGKEQIEIAKEALEFTSEALGQSLERQKLGIAKPYEVFQVQEFYLQAQIDYLKAVSEFNMAQFELKIARGERL